MTKRTLIEIILFLILLIALEAVLVWRYPYAGTYPFFGGGQSAPAPAENLTIEETTPAPSEIEVSPADPTVNTGPTTLDGELKSAVRVFDVSGKVSTPGGSGSQAYQETHQLTAQKSANGWDIAVTTRNTRSADEVNQATVALELDGSYYLTGFEASDADGSFNCSGRVPVYLAVGKDSETASLSCDIQTVEGGTSPPFIFTGSAQATAPVATQFNGKTYQARTLTINGSIGQGGPLEQALQYVAAPGIGELSHQGSLGDLVFGQLLGVVSGESAGTLVSMDNDQFFLP